MQRYDGYANRWFMDPLYKGHYPEDMWQLFGYQVPRMATDDLETIQQPIDFLGVNYYSRGLVKAQEGAFLDCDSLHPEGEYTAMDWEVYPQGLTDLLVRLANDYGVARAVHHRERLCLRGRAHARRARCTTPSAWPTCQQHSGRLP